jgi:FG-GAP-like repeat
MRPIRLAVLVAPALLAALLLAPSTRAQPPVAFDPPTYLSAGNSPVSVATGDFNADDDPDLAVANRFSSTVSVLLGGAAGGFTGPTSFPTGFFSTSVAVGHFNADQDPDLAVANAGDGTVSVLLGGPGGGFSGPTNLATDGFIANSDANHLRLAPTGRLPEELAEDLGFPCPNRVAVAGSAPPGSHRTIRGHNAAEVGEQLPC